MRVAIVFNSPTRLADSSIRYQHYVRGFALVGHEAFLVCSEHSAAGFGHPCVTVANSNAFARKQFWESLRADLVVIVTWLGMADVVRAAKMATPTVIALADSDGYVGARVHPRELLRRMWHLQTGCGNKLRSAGWWLRQYLWSYKDVDRAALEQAEAADFVACHSPAARANLQSFFGYHKRPELAQKVIVSPFPVEESFVERPVPSDRRKQIVAIGRWGDPQKDAPLLRAGIEAYIRGGGHYQFVLAGSGGQDDFRPLCRRHKGQVCYLGVIPPGSVAECLAESRILVSASRWESGPIVGNEALALGCSLVGPSRIPGFAWYCQDRRFGTAFGKRSPGSFAAALLRETEAWDAGSRDPAVIASAWRPLFSPRGVCQPLADLRPLPGLGNVSSVGCGKVTVSAW
jgi:hypothetical protein